MLQKERLKLNVLETKIEFYAGERVNRIRMYTLCINEADKRQFAKYFNRFQYFYVKWKRCAYKAVIYTRTHTAKIKKIRKKLNRERNVMYT